MGYTFQRVATPPSNIIGNYIFRGGGHFGTKLDTKFLQPPKNRVFSGRTPVLHFGAATRPREGTEQGQSSDSERGCLRSDIDERRYAGLGCGDRQLFTLSVK